MAFGGLGGTEILVIIIVIIILFFGARKIPELAKGLGRAMGEFKRGRSEVEREMAQDAARAPQKENKAQAPAPKEPAPAAAAVVDSEIVKAARALGIETEGKTEEQLKKEIAEAMKK